MHANQWFPIAVGADVRESHDVLQGVEYAGICGTSEFEFVITSELVDMLSKKNENEINIKVLEVIKIIRKLSFFCIHFQN